MKEQLQVFKDFKLKNIFKMLDSKNKKFIDQNTIKLYLLKMGHQIFPKEVQSIVRRLDIDGDNKITFSEFYEALQLISLQNPDSVKIKQKNNEIRNI